MSRVVSRSSSNDSIHYRHTVNQAGVRPVMTALTFYPSTGSFCPIKKRRNSPVYYLLFFFIFCLPVLVKTLDTVEDIFLS